MLCKGSVPIRLAFPTPAVPDFGLDTRLGYREYKMNEVRDLSLPYSPLYWVVGAP